MNCLSGRVQELVIITTMEILLRLLSLSTTPCRRFLCARRLPRLSFKPHDASPECASALPGPGSLGRVSLSPLRLLFWHMPALSHISAVVALSAADKVLGAGYDRRWRCLWCGRWAAGFPPVSAVTSFEFACEGGLLYPLLPIPKI